MKKLLTCISVLFIIMSCNTAHQVNASATGLVNLENYTAKDQLNLPYLLNYLIITNQLDFGNTFGIAQSGNINIMYPNLKDKQL